MEVKTKEQYKTWGKSRSNRLTNYDYSADRPIHLTICTENKRNIFDSENRAKITIEELLKTSRDLGFRILCYCLMPNHLHIVISPGSSGIALSKFLNIFKGRTSKVFRESEGFGKLWQRSAYDHIIRTDEDLRGIVEYIRNNPVRGGFTEKMDEYPYSKQFNAEIEKYI
jgi:REP element-mobilizing transposase RayT